MAVLFSDEFNDFTAWTGTVTTPTIVSSPVHHSGNSMKVDNVRDLVYLTSVGAANTYMRFYLNRNTTPNASAAILELWDSGYATAVWIYVDTSNVLWLHAPSGDYSSGITLTADTWFCIEVLRGTGAGSGTAKLWVDGILKVDRTTETISGVVYEIDLGLTTYSTPYFTGYFDCVVIADAYIGVESSGVVAGVQHSAQVIIGGV